MNRIFYIILLILLPFSGACAARGDLGGQNTITVGGVERDYKLVVPDSYRSDRPVPLVFLQHGGGGSNSAIMNYSGFADLAQREGFILVAPNGEGRGWNTEGPFAPGKKRNQMTADDVGFVRALLAKIKSEYKIDDRRIYATGMSMGGMMTYTLACRMADDFAAVAVVSGTLNATSCNPGKPVALLHIHPLNDENVPFEGGKGRLTGNNNSWPPVMRGIDLFRETNRCGDTAQQNTAYGDNMCSTYQGCAKPVKLCRVEGGHQWPGQEQARWQKWTKTDVSDSFRATDYIWAFFKANPK